MPLNTHARREPVHVTLNNSKIRMVIEREAFPHLPWSKMTKDEKKCLTSVVENIFCEKVDKEMMHDKIKQVLTDLRYHFCREIRGELRLCWDGSNEGSIQYNSKRQPEAVVAQLPGELSVVAVEFVKSVSAKVERAERDSAEQRELSRQLAHWQGVVNRVGKVEKTRQHARDRGTAAQDPSRHSHHGQGGPLLFSKNFVSAKNLPLGRSGCLEEFNEKVRC